ncbi:MAG: 4a-hydroxytetrahydrobiopterin dehydratase [Acidobacteriota bacterium]
MSLKMTPQEIEQALESRPGWKFENNAITKKFNFLQYMDGIKFVEAVALEAEAQNHHPDLFVSYAEVNATLSTHSEGGVTQKDLDLAHAMDRIAVDYNARI